MSSTITRRSLVASTAAIPAAAALALPAAADPAGADAELLQLGAELGRIGQEWLAQHAGDRKEHAVWEAACEAAGLPDIAHGSIPDEEWRAHQEKRCAILRPICTDPDLLAWGEINGRMWDVIGKIFDHKPQTLAGFAVQAHALVFGHAEWWDGHDGQGEFEQARNFLEDFCAFAGGTTPAPIQDATASASVS